MKLAASSAIQFPEKSPSVWRVWIEISFSTSNSRKYPSHPPCGGCGLKSIIGWVGYYRLSHPPCGGCGLKLRKLVEEQDAITRSPSVWRVWIEIINLLSKISNFYGHPPCGGCGLKCAPFFRLSPWSGSPSVWRVWIEIHACPCLLP